MTQHKQSHRIKSHGRTSHQPTLHQNRSHHHHGTAEGSFTAKTWFGHRAGRSPCAHSIGKFFLCYIVLFSCETSAPGSPGNYLYIYIYGYFQKEGYFQIIHFNRIFHYFHHPFSGTPIFWKHPYIHTCEPVKLSLEPARDLHPPQASWGLPGLYSGQFIINP